jgi:hypothetical protein
MDNLEGVRRAIQRAFIGDWEAADKAFEELSKEEPFNLIPASVSVPSPFIRPNVAADIRMRTARQTLFFMSVMPINADSSILLDIGGVTFLDVAEALMAFFTLGEFSIDYMPIAKRRGVKSLRGLMRFLEKLGIIYNKELSGMGNAIAKALLYTTKNVNMAHGLFLSAAIANTLRAELADFEPDRVKTVVMETVSRYRRIRDVVENWLTHAPKLYLRDTKLFYDWEDAVKDAVAGIKSSKDWPDFRFTV